MAKIVEEMIVVKVSKLVKDDASTDSLITEDFAAGIEAVATELMQDPAAIVEVIVPSAE